MKPAFNNALLTAVSALILLQVTASKGKKAARTLNTGLHADKNQHLQGIRGANSNRLSFVEPEEHRKLGTYYDSVYLCGTPDSSTQDYDHYFWMTLYDDSDKVASDDKVKGMCLLYVEKGSDQDYTMCCQAELDGNTTVDYSDDYVLVVEDPHMFKNCSGCSDCTDEDMEIYEACGSDGGSECSNYKYDHNEMAFSDFKVLYSDTSCDSNNTRTMSKFVHKDDDNSEKCGLGDKEGDCDDDHKVYGDVHVGKGECLESVITLYHECDSHYGYKCEEDDCDCDDN